ncbi:MAG: DUF763 domain-containing protein [Desulfurococcaceae archaeon]
MAFEGFAELPLHDGHVPPWLLRIMERMAAAIIEAAIDEHGPGRVAELFANPFWFQAFNNVIGMDWDSSGSTTVLTGVLKAVTWRRPELGLLVLGGKGARARRVPEEAAEAARLLGLGDEAAEAVARTSKAIAKVDGALIQAGYSLYHHAVFLSSEGKWSVVQQGMNVERRTSRRYHWRTTENFLDDPHEAVCGVKHDQALNLASRRSGEAREVIADLLREDPARVSRLYARAYNAAKGQATLFEGPASVLVLGERAKAYMPLMRPEELERRLRSLDVVVEGFADVLHSNLGPSTLRALALISHLIYEAPASFEDPANTPLDPFAYAFAIGGKDGVPYPVNRREAERVVATLEDIVSRARMGDRERLRAFRSLSRLRIKVVGKHI